MKKELINKTLYFFITFILITAFYFEYIYKLIEYEKLLKILFLLFSILIILFKIEFFKTKKNLIIIFILCIFMLILKRYYVTFAFFIISAVVNLKTRLKINLFVLLFYYILTIFFNNFGVLDFNNLSNGIRKYGELMIFRHSLGFSHPNTAMAFLLPIFFIIYYLYYSKYEKIIVLFMTIIGGFIFYYTYSRTSFLLVILFIILVIIKDKYIKKLKNIFIYEGLFLFVFSIIFSFAYSETKLNKILSGRLYLFKYYLMNYDLTLFGDDVFFKNIRKIYPLDNSYIVTLFENGVLALILLILLTICIMKILYKNEDYKGIRIFSIILLYGFTEGGAFFYYFNIVLLILQEYIFIINKNVRKLNEKNNKYNSSYL